MAKIKNFAIKRGYELMMASGCEHNMYKIPNNIDFEDDCITMMFEENINDNGRHCIFISLDIEQLNKNDEDWSLFIEKIKQKNKQDVRELSTL